MLFSLYYLSFSPLFGETLLNYFEEKINKTIAICFYIFGGLGAVKKGYLLMAHKNRSVTSHCLKNTALTLSPAPGTV